MVYYVTLCHVMLCYVILYHVMSCCLVMSCCHVVMSCSQVMSGHHVFYLEGIYRTDSDNRLGVYQFWGVPN